MALFKLPMESTTPITSLLSLETLVDFSWPVEPSLGIYLLWGMRPSWTFYILPSRLSTTESLLCLPIQQHWLAEALEQLFYPLKPSDSSSTKWGRWLGRMSLGSLPQFHTYFLSCDSVYICVFIFTIVQCTWNALSLSVPCSYVKAQCICH